MIKSTKRNKKTVEWALSAKGLDPAPPFIFNLRVIFATFSLRSRDTNGVKYTQQQATTLWYTIAIQITLWLILSTELHRLAFY